MSTNLQFVLSNATAGMDAEYNVWYSGPHTDHVLKIPGMLAGQRFRRIEADKWPDAKHEYLMIWEIDDPKFALEQLANARGGDDMPLSPALDDKTIQPPTMWKRASVRSAARIATDTASRKTIVFVLVNAVKGEEHAFEKSIINGGLAALADLPGVLGADFLTLAEEQIRGSARKFAYGLMIELADEAVGMASITEPVKKLPHVDYGKWMASVFRPMEPRRFK